MVSHRGQRRAFVVDRPAIKRLIREASRDIHPPPQTVPRMVQVEFYGIPRVRAGVARTTARGGSIAQVLQDLAGRFPNFGRECLHPETEELRPEYALCINGESFVRASETRLVDGATVLILSADVGG